MIQRLTPWLLTAGMLAAGWHLHGAIGLAFAATVVVFWLLLQFGRALRVMQNAGRAPVGLVPSAVMVHSKLRSGMTFQDVLGLTRSLGRPVDGAADSWAWSDEGGACVTVTLPAGRVTSWRLTRPEAPGEPVDGGTGATSP